MKFKVRCFSYLRRRTGHNDDEVHSWEFEPELIMGIGTNVLTRPISIQSTNPDRFTVGEYYEFEIKP